MEIKKNNDISDAISLGEILVEIVNKKFIVIGLVLLGILCSFFYAKFFAKPKYTACAKMLITKSSVEGEQISTGEFSISQYLIRDYNEIISDKVVLSRVIDELNLETTSTKLKSKIEIKNPSNSRVLEIYVTDKKPENAQKIANKICEVAKQEIYVILNNQDTINIMSTADVPKTPSGPNLMRHLVRGFLGGLAAALAVVFVFYVFDDTIKGKKDVKRYLGLEVLSVIPYSNAKENSITSATRGNKNGRY